MELIDGPYDGANGPSTQEGVAVLWFDRDPQQRAPNGLRIWASSGPGRAKYVYAGDGRYVHGDAGTLAPAARSTDRRVTVRARAVRRTIRISPVYDGTAPRAYVRVMGPGLK